MRRVGIYPGTFDPVHAGHISFAKAALASGLDEVILIPEADPRYKTNVTELRHRAAMLRQATEPHERLALQTLRSSRFTIAETLPELQQLFPGAELSFLLGSDVARTLPQWEGLDQLGNTRFVIGMRRTDNTDDVAAIASHMRSQYQVELTLLPAGPATSHAASSTIRSGDRSQLPAEILPYITLHNLYR